MINTLFAFVRTVGYHGSYPFSTNSLEKLSGRQELTSACHVPVVGNVLYEQCAFNHSSSLSLGSLGAFTKKAKSRHKMAYTYTGKKKYLYFPFMFMAKAHKAKTG